METAHDSGLENVSLWDWTEFFLHEMGLQVGVSPPAGWGLSTYNKFHTVCNAVGRVCHHGNRIRISNRQPPKYYIHIREETAVTVGMNLSTCLMEPIISDSSSPVLGALSSWEPERQQRFTHV